MTKLKIDLKTGVLEVEGEEAFVKEIYQDYKAQLTPNEFMLDDSSNNIQGEDLGLPNPGYNKAKLAKKKNGKAKDGSKRKESYSFVTDLNFLSKNGNKALKSFYIEKSPTNAMEKNTVFVYYLQKELKITNIGVNHVYTCYKHVEQKIPGALRQSLVDTASRKGWLDTKSMDNITVSTLGENLVEHELGKSKNDKK